MSKKELIIPAFSLFIICLLTAAALSVTNYFTEPKIERRTAEDLQTALSRLLPADNYDLASIGITGSDEAAMSVYYKAMHGGEPIGYLFTTSSKGYGGDVTVLTAVSTEGKIIAIEVLELSGETPGLGQNWSKKENWEQFAGKSIEIGVAKNNPKDHEIVAVTGATITSKAVTEAVNTAL
ncbi:MAG: RnfABCDGE type electron transport complex subunit G, partial [Oscillospiraceae bacterium]|nr:RnfABCDGE type electron transport complex subunit G [Oscillospiraceae bacterium]